MSIQILLVDDHAIVREGFRALLEKQPDFRLVGEAENGRQAVEMADRLCPDVVVMDVGMSNLNGVDATRQIITRDPKVRVVALSAYTQKQFVMAILEAGASAYVTKNSARDELMRSIRAVVKGQKYLSPDVAGVVVNGCIGGLSPTDQPARTDLSDREREVLQLLAEGHTSKSIGTQLQISENTVEVHRRSISKKLNLYGVAELTKFAIREGITPL